MIVTLMDFTPDSEFKLGIYSSICYDSSKIDRESCVKRTTHCKDKGHLSVLRFASAVIKVSGISRVCLTQLTRSKHLDYLVRSSRYCEESNAEFYRPESFDGMSDELKQKWSDHENKSKILYDELRSEKITKQDARFILPQSQETELYIVGNFNAWRDFIALRTSNDAQYEVRQVALMIQEELRIVAPNIF
jgi:thymidylate synthase (FAD)